jgi:transcriptional regulator with XRE-family HTH domain
MAPIYVRSLIELLKFLGWEQKAIAKRLKVSTSAVSLWATGKRPVPQRYEKPLIGLVLEEMRRDKATMDAELEALKVGINEAPPEERERRLDVLQKWEAHMQQVGACMDGWENELYVTAGKCADEIRYRLGQLQSPYAHMDPMKLSREDRHRLRQACQMLVRHFDYLDQFDRAPPPSHSPLGQPIDVSTPEAHLQLLRDWFGVAREGEEE